MAARTKHVSLTGGQAQTVTLDQPYTQVKVINRTTGAAATGNEIYVRGDGTTAVVGADGTFVVPGQYAAEEIVPCYIGTLGVQAGGTTYSGTSVSLISTNATSVSVIGVV